MAEITRCALLQDVRCFGWRVFELTEGASGEAHVEANRSLRKVVSAASRNLSRRAAAFEGRVARREAEQAYKHIGEAVEALDRIAVAAPTLAVDASAFAAEATGLNERIFELIAS